MGPGPPAGSSKSPELDRPARRRDGIASLERCSAAEHSTDHEADIEISVTQSSPGTVWADSTTRDRRS